MVVYLLCNRIKLDNKYIIKVGRHSVKEEYAKVGNEMECLEKNRVCNLQTGNFFKIEVIGYWNTKTEEADIKLENSLKKELDKYGGDGGTEWFMIGKNKFNSLYDRLDIPDMSPDEIDTLITHYYTNKSPIIKHMKQKIEELKKAYETLIKELKPIKTKEIVIAPRRSARLAGKKASIEIIEISDESEYDSISSSDSNSDNDSDPDYKP